MAVDPYHIRGIQMDQKNNEDIYDDFKFGCTARCFSQINSAL